MANEMKWGSHVYRVGANSGSFDTAPSEDQVRVLRQRIEPWLAAVLQSEHASLLVGNGITAAVAATARTEAASMASAQFGCPLEDRVNAFAKTFAETSGRGVANFEDQLRAAIALQVGLEIAGDPNATAWTDALNKVLNDFLKSIIATERGLRAKLEGDSDEGLLAKRLLSSFLLSFGARLPTRDRLHIFTTNYERLIEFGCDLVGIRIVDRFVGVSRSGLSVFADQC